MQTQSELIKYFETKLEKVKQFYNPEKSVSELQKGMDQARIGFAEKQLVAIKNGRAWW